jgi:hypothetical protein
VLASAPASLVIHAVFQCGAVDDFGFDAGIFDVSIDVFDFGSDGSSLYIDGLGFGAEGFDVGIGVFGFGADVSSLGVDGVGLGVNGFDTVAWGSSVANACGNAFGSAVLNDDGFCAAVVDGATAVAFFFARSLRSYQLVMIRYMAHLAYRFPGRGLRRLPATFADSAAFKSGVGASATSFLSPSDGT